MVSQTGFLAPQTSVSECLDRMAAGAGRSRPVATYRLQFHRGFRFDDARKFVAYLHALGISHCYSSPILKSRPGSMHGYDIIDHNQINPELGGEDQFRSLVRDLRQAGLGLLLDVVPNHMGAGHGANPWWQDVLQNGQASEFANYFDIDWTPLKGELHGKVLLPILGDQYGDELDRGNIVLHFENDVFFFRYYDRLLPIDPQTYDLIFEPLDDLRDRQSEAQWKSSGMADLDPLLGEFRRLPHHSIAEGEELHQRRRGIPNLKRRFAQLVAESPAVRDFIDEAVKRCNGQPGNHRSFDLLHRLLEAQAYRLAHWRVSGEEINYRRFFDINDLVGLRMENPEVFAATHRLYRCLLAEGLIDGIRLDHPDGLYNPVQYFARLQMLYAAAHCCGRTPVGRTAENGIEEEVVNHFNRCEWHQPALYVLVEKLLEPREDLPQLWPIGGSVGYEFGNLVNGIFIDRRNARTFTTLYSRFIGGPMDVGSVIYAAKRLILKESLASEALVLMHMLDEIASTDRHARDFTRHSLLEAIRETIACFPVYRTYIDARGGISDSDRHFIQTAIARAKRRNESMSAKIFDFIAGILLLRDGRGGDSALDYRKRLRFTLKFQQLTGPVMAKGLEDTACYVYNRLLSENEVGSSPEEFGFDVCDFHSANVLRAHHWPDSMLSTSTHDSKRSEDVRARLNVLTEIPKLWSANAMRWRRLNKPKKKIITDGRLVPDRNEEYLLYQTLVGVWPLAIEMDAGERKEFVGRIQQYITKAVHEAKVNLSWTNQNPEYKEALEQFIARILQPGTSSRPNLFLRSLEQFLPPIQFFGCINSVAQVLLKLTCPGVPDVYQGQELWDFSLVDPDNRRPVDFALRVRMVGDLLAASSCVDGDGSGGLTTFCDDLVRNFVDGHLKLWTTVAALRFRRDHAALFQNGSYCPLVADGEKSEHVVAFAREHEGHSAVTAVPLLAYTLCGGRQNARLSDCWGETFLPLQHPRFRNVFTGEVLQTSGGAVSCRELFAHFPVALLLSI
jgi:(1->4)-alpha-D-glucan 1-alpha-D-glucosylmutase